MVILLLAALQTTCPEFNRVAQNIMNNDSMPYEIRVDVYQTWLEVKPPECPVPEIDIKKM